MHECTPPPKVHTLIMQMWTVDIVSGVALTQTHIM